MTAITWNRSDASDEGLRPFDSRRHLRQVAELIAQVFADELDTSGRGALQEMQWVSRLSPVLGSVMSSAFFTEFVQGYVWVESGRVIGNVTLQRADVSGTRWRISNVAVAPGRRGRGHRPRVDAGRAARDRGRGGNWAILQVRVDNPSARHLYDSLGFTAVCQDGTWQLPPAALPVAARPAPAVELQPLAAAHWQDRLDLARSARSPLAHWANPIEPGEYQPALSRIFGSVLADLAGLQRLRRWGVWQDQRLMGAVDVTLSRIGETHQLRFEVRPEARGRFEPALVAQGLRALSAIPIRPVTVEHSGDDAEGVAALEAAGFRAQRILLTMRRLIRPGE